MIGAFVVGPSFGLITLLRQCHERTRHSTDSAPVPLRRRDKYLATPIAEIIGGNDRCVCVGEMSFCLNRIL
jgi:hypothetical protein